MANPDDETRADLPAVPPPPPPGYYPPLQPPSPQLPDFKPHRMSLLDKILSWVVVFVVLIFGLILAAHFLLKPAPVGTPSPHTSTSAPAHHSTKAKAAVCPSSST